MTAIDPAFVQGRTLTLNGTQAESFVRARKSMEDDTNLARMARQRQYLGQLPEAGPGQPSTPTPTLW